MISKDSKDFFPLCMNGFCLISLVPFLAGCDSSAAQQGELVEVTGKVLCQGEPLSSGVVRFEPIPLKSESAVAQGILKEDGLFSLRTSEEPGAFAGKYRVLLTTANERTPGMITEGSPNSCKLGDTGQTVQVNFGSNNYFEIHAADQQGFHDPVAGE
ncbi:hypothetical protein [Rubinisphaera italica]|uniref:Carboxypeptidase regulatory-like domain-containing protein n=1 Tax=Rubinisphaera italica TaxID=2527969 RepID=A0A5C5X9H7_9PLAN|nr:hypothetical protein [Rubinisphaera italica]TWT59636.1 hypothetical protein Pan54_03440 [Rubinisphaera italica]